MSTKYLVRENADGVVNNLTIEGLSGNGYLKMPTQSVIPTPPVDGVVVYSGLNYVFSMKGASGNEISFDDSNLTSDIVIEMPDTSGKIVFESDTGTFVNKTIIGGDSGNIVVANNILGVEIGVTAPTANQVLIASSGAAAGWGFITDASFSGTLTVAKGGTGLSSLTSGRFLIGAGTSVDLTKVAPSGVVVGTTDTQTLTAKTIVGGTSGNDITANKILGVTIGVTAPTANQVLSASSGTAASWVTLTDSSFSGTLTVAKGGTGVSSLTSGRFVIGAGATVDLTKVVPSGTVVGTTDTQTLTAKTIVGGTSGNDITANKILGVTLGVTAPTTNQVLIASSGTAASWGLVTDSSFSGTLTVAKGGTGVSSLTSGRFVIGNGTSAVDLTKAAPSGAVVGTTDTQTLTAKTIVGGSSGNDITANNILGVAVGVTAPTANQVLIASSGTAASWASATDAILSGTISVAKGGTGVSSLTSGRFVIGNGTSTVDLTKVVPSGVVVGTTDTQTLTGKTLSSASNTIDANRLQTINISASAPTNGQVLSYNSSSTQWEPTTASGGGVDLTTRRWTVKDIKSVGTNGGSVTANTWTTRTLNTLAGSSNTSVTLASNQITFTAGTYFITAMAPGRGTGFHKIRLRNVSSGTILAHGMCSEAPNNTTTTSMLAGYFTFASTTITDIQHLSVVTRTNTGFGAATGSGDEVYTTVVIEKLN